MSKLKKYGLIATGVIVSGLVMLFSFFSLFKKKRRITVVEKPEQLPPPPDIVERLKAQKERIDETVRNMDRDTLADGINSEYD